MRSRTSTPAAGSPCIWMQAGVIDYWLCDRSFNCEACPLDRALRGRFADRSQRVPRVTTPHSSSLRFHPSHLWLNPVSETEWKLGLDHHALHAFTEPATVSLPRAGRRIAKEEQLLSLLIDGDALRWPSPVDLVVLERNDHWDDNAARLRELPDGDNWLLLVKLPHGLVASAWMAADEMEQSCHQERVTLQDLCMAASTSESAIGETAADGGLLLRPADQILPRKTYFAFLRGRWGLMPADAGF